MSLLPSDLRIEHVLLGASILLLLSVIASKTSGRLGVPALLLFLIVGMLAGSEGPGGIYFDDALLAQSLGVIALIFILFDGGLNTDWRRVRPVLRAALSLSTVGVLITAMLVGWFAAIALGFSWLEGLLLGAVISSTDAAAVFTVLRARKAGLKGRLAPLIELESGSNDPMAVFLTLSLIGLLTHPGALLLDLIPFFILQMTLGAALGYAMGRLIIPIVNRVRLEYEGLYPVLTIALVLFTYGAAASLGGNGFLAVYLAGLVVENNNLVHKNSVIRFHDGLAWLMQITMFLTLGLLVFPSRLIPVAGAGLGVAAFLMFVARPVSVFIALLASRFSRNEKLMVAWVGLRGAVPIILATFPLLAGIPKSDWIFNVVFFAVIASVALQGPTIPFVARWLKVAAPIGPTPRSPVAFVPEPGMQSQLAEVEVPHDSGAVGRQIVKLDLPEGALIVLIGRNGNFVVPRGNTILEAGDRLLVLADAESLSRVRAIVTDKS